MHTEHDLQAACQALGYREDENYFRTKDSLSMH